MKMVYLGIHKDVYDAFEEIRKSTCPENDPTTLLNAVLYNFCCNSGYSPNGVFAGLSSDKDVEK